jgi:glycerate kinase
LVAPDKFKTSFSSLQVADAIAAGVQSAGIRDVERRPIADGGEGTMEVMLRTFGGRRVTREVRDPIGRLVEAQFALLRGGEVAVIEMAEASGLGRVAESERNAERASSIGTGQLIAAALTEGASEIVVGAGGRRPWGLNSSTVKSTFRLSPTTSEGYA